MNRNTLIEEVARKLADHSGDGCFEDLDAIERMDADLYDPDFLADERGGPEEDAEYWRGFARAAVDLVLDRVKTELFKEIDPGGFLNWESARFVFDSLAQKENNK